MMITCDWCGEPTDGKQVVVIERCGKYTVCVDCLNSYGNQDFDSLERKVSKHLKEFEVR